MNIEHKLTINASPETIYEAVSTQKGITGWWSKDCQVSEVEGENSQLTFDKQGQIVKMGFKTLTLIPNKKVVWECIENGNPAWLGTKIITEIQSSDKPSEILFSHAGFDDKWAGQDPFEMTKQGWAHFVDSLVSYCENGEGAPW